MVKHYPSVLVRPGLLGAVGTRVDLDPSKFYKAFLFPSWGVVSLVYQLRNAAQANEDGTPVESQQVIQKRLVGHGGEIYLDGQSVAWVATQQPSFDHVTPAGAVSSWNPVSPSEGVCLQEVPNLLPSTLVHGSWGVFLSYDLKAALTVAVNQTDAWIVPTGVRWRVRQCSGELTTSAVIASRELLVRILRNGSPNVSGRRLIDTAAITASSNGQAFSAEGWSSATAGAVARYMSGSGTLALPGDIIEVQLSELQIGDKVAIYVALEVEADS